jgi:hypothetical protein
VNKCNESARRLFGANAYCAALEMDLGELLPESYDAIRDGDKIRATVAYRTEAESAATSADKEKTVLDKEDWMALRESKINPGLAWERFVSDVGVDSRKSPHTDSRVDVPSHSQASQSYAARACCKAAASRRRGAQTSALACGSEAQSASAAGAWT